MSNINFTYTNLTPFKWYVLENFPFIEADFDALTNWQLFCKLGKEMNKIINSVNVSGQQVETLTNAFNELQNYVNNYFNNLDVQEEINNKLDQMTQDGTLESLIGKYVDPYFIEFNEKIEEQNNKINSITSGSPAGTYNTLTELQSANPDHTKIYLVLENGNWYYYNNSTSQWTSGGKYLDTTNFNEAIQDLTITKNQFPYNTQNLFDKLEWLENKSITDSSATNSTTSNYESKTINSDYTRISRPIRVRYDNGVPIFTPNNWKWFNKGNTASLGICYDVNGNYSSLIMGNSSNLETLPEDCYFIIFKQYYTSSNFVLLLPFNINYLNNKIVDLTPGYFAKFSDGNIFEHINWINGKNFNSQSANFNKISIFYLEKFTIDSEVASYSEPIQIKDLNGNPIFEDKNFNWNNINTTEANLAILFDSFGNYVKILTRDDLTFTENSYYIVFIKYSNINNYVTLNKINVDWLSASNSEKIYYVGPTRENTSFTALIKSLKDDWSKKVIYIDSGTYDIFEEIGGKSFIDTIPDTADWSSVSTIIPPNTKIIGIGKVIFNFLPTSSDITLFAGGLLSPINTRGGVEIENITINATNCRYCIHDEVSLLTNYDGLSHIYKNVTANYIKGDLNPMPSGQAFGCGFNSNNNFLFENCVFTTTKDNTPAWSIHDRNSYGDNGSTIICNNCIFISDNNVSASLRNIHTQDTITEIDVSFNSCFIKNNIEITNDTSILINNSFDVTLLNTNLDNVVIDENLNNTFTPKIYNY